MPKTKYKQKPLFWYCLQFTGDNVAEMLEFSDRISWDEEGQRLVADKGVHVINVTDWVMEDQAGNFSGMVDEQFQAFFQLEGGPSAKPGPE
jgi:hypothetical protein